MPLPRRQLREPFPQEGEREVRADGLALEEGEQGADIGAGLGQRRAAWPWGELLVALGNRRRLGEPGTAERRPGPLHELPARVHGALLVSTYFASAAST